MKFIALQGSVLAKCNGFAPRFRHGFTPRVQAQRQIKTPAGLSRSVKEVQITVDLSWPELVAIASALGISLKLPRSGTNGR
jgi:hypothetical protein